MNNIRDYFKIQSMAVLVGLSASMVGSSEVVAAGVPDSISIVAPRIQISGRIVNASTGLGFAGVRITSPNVKASAMTDEEGRYEIALPADELLLQIEGPGFARQFVPVKGRSVVDVQIREENGVNYYDADLSASDARTQVSAFTSEAQNIPLALSSALSGQVRSQIQSGDPGSGASFFIRGLNSLNISAQPLFVVDGVQWQMQETQACVVDGVYNNPLTLIDPNDIENVTVLKDGTALWGANGANGVVLITTKRGRDMATRIDANVSFGFQSPFKSVPVMGADAYKRYATDVMRGMTSEELSKLQFTGEDPSKSSYYDSHNNTDWLDQINKTSLIQNYGISVSGGDDKALYRFSLGYADNKGNIESSDFNRLNIRFNSDIKLTKQFDIMADVSYAQTGYDVTFGGIDEMRSPYYIALIKSPLYNAHQFNGSGRLTNRLSDTDELNVGNPVSLTDQVPSLDKYRFNLNARPTYHFNDRLEVSALFGFSWDKANENVFLPDAGMADEPLYNDQGEVYAIGNNEVRNLMARQSTVSIDVNATWQVLQDYRNDLKATFGGRFINDYYRYTAGVGYNTGSDFMTGLSNTNGDLRTLTGNNRKDREATWHLNADYNYLHRYFLQVAMSLETSSRFGSKADGVDLCGVSWGFFPTVSAAWLVSSERFMRDVDFVNHLKLRASYSMLGNSRLPEFANRTYFTSASFARNAVGLVLANIGNDQLQWESTKRANVGLDFSLFSNRWTMNFDAYTSKTEDLLTRKSLRDVAGLDYYWSNDGAMTNKGFEVATQVKVLDDHDLKLTAGLMMGHYKNEITSLNNGSYITEVAGGQILTATHHPAGLFYGYRTSGIYRTAAEAAADGLAVETTSGKRVAFEAGDVRFIDRDHNTVIDDNDRVILGDPNPDFYGNFNLSLRYKQFELGALFTYSCGNDAYNALRASLESGSSLINQSTALENRWRADAQNTDVPRATYGDPMGNARFSDRWIEDASYLKLKQVTLVYHIPFKTNFLQNISVWASAGNLFTWTKYLGADPEFSYNTSSLYQGVDAGMTPQSRSFRLGVNISL